MGRDFCCSTTCSKCNAKTILVGFISVFLPNSYPNSYFAILEKILISMSELFKQLRFESPFRHVVDSFQSIMVT